MRKVELRFLVFLKNQRERFLKEGLCTMRLIPIVVCCDRKEITDINVIKLHQNTVYSVFICALS